MASSPLLSIFGVLNKLQEKFSSTASSSSTFDVPRLKQLNDMVYEVHSPQPGEKPELEVVFFHGLQVRRSEDAYVTTWMTRDNSQLWLQTWLVELFPKARIFTVSYDSSAKRTHESGRLDMYCTGENLVSSLTADEVRVGQAGCPVVLVGHCLGGLVLKELCLNAAWMLSRKSPEKLQRVNNLFSNLRGMFFYATPHTGSVLGDELHVHFNGALLEEIQTMKASTARRNQEFDDLKSKCGWLTSGIGEVNETYVECLGRKPIHMVPEASTRPYMDSYYSATTDHYDICKPQEKTDSALLHLKDFLKKIQEGGALRVMNDAQSHNDYYIDLKGRAIQVTEMLAQPNVHTIFITGLSGIGKSALAQEVFHNMRHNFAVTCFVSLDTIDVPSNDNVQMWQKIQYSLEPGLEEVAERSISNRYTLLRYLKSKKVLMVVDNLHSEEQLKALETRTWLEGTSSKLIVTTTNTRLGTSSNTSLACFQVPYLNDEESHHLFSKYAFENGEVPRYLKPLIAGVIMKCANFPLALKILGGYASKEDVHNPRLWQELMERMDKAVDVESGPDYRLWATLRICFEALGPIEQELFLDVATFFHDVPFSLVECISDGCREVPFTSWNNLKKRFLANEDKNGKIQMHSQLRVLGQSIACDRTTTVDKWSRVYKTKDARELIAKHQPGVKDARGLKLQSEEHERLFLAETTFDPYLHLRYLMLEGVEITGKNVKLPTSLVYLRWTNSLFEICPVDFSNLENLVAMDLRNCKCMKSLPSGLGNVGKLRWLGLEGCVSLTEPFEILSNFRHLKHLELSNTGDLGTNETQMTMGLNQVCSLQNLMSLDLSKTKVSAIPEAISTLRFLTTLNARHTNLRSLPESIGKLITLETLDLNYTPLEKLPDSICKLRKLRVCRLGATKVSTLPNKIGNLLQLEILIVSGTVRKVPDTFSKLKRLKEYQGRLTFHDSSIKHLAKLESLGSLSLDLRDLGEESPLAVIDGRSQVAIYSLLTPLFSLYALTKLTLWGRYYAQSLLPQLFCALQKIPYLQELHLRNFLSAEIMPHELGTLSKLKRLMIWECDKLKELPESLGNLSNLTLLYLKDLPRLSRLPESLVALSSRSDLYIMECESLQSMPSSFGHMSSLQRNEFATPSSECPSPSQLQSLRLCTSSWSLLECFLECYGGQHALLYVQCEEMEKVMKKVSRNREGVLHVLGPKAAVELFREMELSRRERENGLREGSGPFAPHPSWRHCIAFQFFVICCVDPSEHYTNDYCHVHSKWVGVMGTEEIEESDTDTETEEDEADSETEEDKVDREMGEDKLLTATSVMMLALLFASKNFLTHQRNREDLVVRSSVHKFYTLIFRICFVFHSRKLELRRGRR